MTLPALKDWNIAFSDLFLLAVKDVFETQCGTTVTGHQLLQKPELGWAHVQITSSVGVTASDFNGSVTFIFSKEVFLTIAQNVLGETYQDINDENADLAGELLNMVFGRAKARYYEKNKTNIQPAIPVVIKGEKLSPPSTHGSLFQVETGHGRFHIWISLKNL